MSDVEILQTAIRKAIELGGYVFHSGFTLRTVPEKLLIQKRYYGIIFSHEFAKAFWGDEIRYNKTRKTKILYISKWAHHLQQMVLEEEPLKYLRKFL